MTALVFEKKTRFPVSAEVLFRWHEQLPDAFNKLLPPGEPVRILHHDGHLRDGARAVLRVGPWPFRLHWELRHTGYEAGRQFCDEQVKGPFRSWRHVHRMIPDGVNASILHDRVEFELPCGFIGRLIGRAVVLPKLAELFAFRHTATLRDLAP